MVQFSNRGKLLRWYNLVLIQIDMWINFYLTFWQNDPFMNPSLSNEKESLRWYDSFLISFLIEVNCWGDMILSQFRYICELILLTFWQKDPFMDPSLSNEKESLRWYYSFLILFWSRKSLREYDFVSIQVNLWIDSTLFFKNMNLFISRDLHHFSLFTLLLWKAFFKILCRKYCKESPSKFPHVLFVFYFY